MTVLSVVTTKRVFGEDNLSITLRNVGGEPAPIQSALVVKTVNLWLYLRKLIDAGERTSPLDKTPEMAVSAGNNITFEPWQETRVTVFDWSNRYGLTVHSDTMAQTALDTYWGMHDALSELVPQNAAISQNNATSSASTAQTGTNTHEPQNGVVRVVGWKAAKELAPGTQFVSPIAQIEAAMDKKGVLTWELFCPYGGKAGQYKDFVVYSDNEHTAQLNQILMQMCGKAGTAITGSWLASGNVTESKGKKYVNITDVVQS